MSTIFSRRTFLRQAGRVSLAGIGGSLVNSSLRGWLPSGISDLSSTINKASGYAESIQKGATAVQKAAEEFTPEQEYYIGRTVGAVVLGKYRVHDNQAATRYLNIVSQTLAQASDLPETFNGYHLLILDAEEINAFATPSGLIFVTRGMLRCCENEGELAAILAHEVGHVQHKHGMQSIEKGRVTEALTVIGLEATKTFAQSDIASLTRSFEGSINDITTTMISSGYSRSFEAEADLAAVTILRRVGYDPAHLVRMLARMDSRLKPGGIDFAKTHPSPKSRIEELRKAIAAGSQPVLTVAQNKRYIAAMRDV
ncbi:MAG: M48 family metallopeptidase [Desulfobulbaceae bacterium]